MRAERSRSECDSRSEPNPSSNVTVKRFERFEVQCSAIEATWELVARANALVEQKAPWKLAKEPAQSELLDAVLYTLAETVRLLALLVSPVIPTASEKILEQLQAGNLRTLQWGGFPSGHVLGKPTPILLRFENAKV